MSLPNLPKPFSKVIIDGVEYVPAKDVQPANSRAIKIALIEQFWGECSNWSDKQLDAEWKGLYVRVLEEPGEHGQTIDEVLNRISELGVVE